MLSISSTIWYPLTSENDLKSKYLKKNQRIRVNFLNIPEAMIEGTEDG